MYVGQYILDHYLPTLNTDALKTRQIINVSDEELKEHTRISEELSNSYHFNGGNGDSTEAFKRYKKYNDFLAEKYLPKVLECKIPKVYPTDMSLFIQGITETLWDSDLSWYSTQDIEFEQTEEYAWCSYIRLKLEISN